MAMNRVQFQRGLPMAEFMDRYGTQEKCEAALTASRWPTGFVCPRPAVALRAARFAGRAACTGSAQSARISAA
jgi:Transposase zinc-ribbon domain